MTKITIATDDQGNVIGAVQQGTSAQGAAGDPKVGVSFAPGVRMHTVEVGPDLDMAKAKDAKTFRDALKRYVPKG